MTDPVWCEARVETPERPWHRRRCSFRARHDVEVEGKTRHVCGIHWRIRDRLHRYDFEEIGSPSPSV